MNIGHCTVRGFNFILFGEFHLKILFREKYQCGYRKNAEFYADFKFVDAGFQKYSKKS
jgi:hypothetical protein